MKQIPIPATSVAQQATITTLVDRILASKRNDPAANVTAWELEINRLVYGLFGLTKEEIRVVELEGS